LLIHTEMRSKMSNMSTEKKYFDGSGRHDTWAVFVDDENMTAGELVDEDTAKEIAYNWIYELEDYSAVSLVNYFTEQTYYISSETKDWEEGKNEIH